MLEIDRHGADLDLRRCLVEPRGGSSRSREAEHHEALLTRGDDELAVPVAVEVDFGKSAREPGQPGLLSQRAVRAEDRNAPRALVADRDDPSIRGDQRARRVLRRELHAARVGGFGVDQELVLDRDHRDLGLPVATQIAARDRARACGKLRAPADGELHRGERSSTPARRIGGVEPDRSDRVVAEREDARLRSRPDHRRDPAPDLDPARAARRGDDLVRAVAVDVPGDQPGRLRSPRVRGRELEPREEGRRASGVGGDRATASGGDQRDRSEQASDCERRAHPGIMDAQDLLGNRSRRRG